MKILSVGFALNQDHTNWQSVPTVSMVVPLKENLLFQDRIQAVPYIFQTIEKVDSGLYMQHNGKIMFLYALKAKQQTHYLNITVLRCNKDYSCFIPLSNITAYTS